MVVTDGFTGNVALKTMEGAARLIADTLREEFTRNPVAQARRARRAADAQALCAPGSIRDATMARPWSA